MGAHHSQSLEAWFAHVPGLKIAMPATAADAMGLLQTAIRDENPVLFVEHRGLYRIQGEVPNSDDPLVFGKARIVREGSDVTVVALSRMVQTTLEAADDLAADGISIEIVDPRTIVPLDLESIVSSAKKTGRIVIAHEAVEYGGIGAEIIAQIQSAAFYHLDRPMLRVAPPFV